jgi:hypothetical protein
VTCVPAGTVTLSAPGQTPLTLTVTSISTSGLTTCTTAESCGLTTGVPVTVAVPAAEAVSVTSVLAVTCRLSVSLWPGLSAKGAPGTTPYWLSVTTMPETGVSPVFVTV